MADSQKPGANEPLSRSDRIALRISAIQTVLAVSGFLVGIIALYAALNESDAVRKQQEASVWPRISFGRDYVGLSGSTKFTLSLRNVGIGPAEIRSARATLDGEPVTSSFQIAQKIASERFIGSNATIINEVLRPGDEMIFFEIDEAVNRGFGLEALQPDLFRSAYDDRRLKFEICYCSVFDQCWRLSSGEARPENVRQCVDHGDQSYTF